MAKRKRLKDGEFHNPAPKTKRPRSQALPGLEDRAIKPLEDVAASYAEIRDERMELTKREAELKANALKLMKKYDKTIYRHDGIEIRVIDGEPDVKVKIKKPGEDEEDMDAPPPTAAEIRASADEGAEV